LLPNGKVLVAGGYNDTYLGSYLPSAELYDPVTGTWTPTGSMNIARECHTATLLSNGQVLVAGGYNDNYLSSAELYDPATGTWTPTGSMTAARMLHTAALTPNGQVLVAGGCNSVSDAELYDPATGMWTPTGLMISVRVSHTATVLTNGQVLAIGGYDYTNLLSSAELYDPATGTWTNTGAMVDIIDFGLETTWNWGGQGTGGGISTYYTIPSWQQGIDMTLNHGSTTMRNIPDVALTADNVYVVYNNGQSNIFGGTSCAAPLWAGFTALVNQQAVAAGRPTVGFVNPAVYTIGNSTNYTADFHDITTGNNTWNGSPTNFYAVPGYDLCTGWGTPAGQNLIDDLAGIFVPVPVLTVNFGYRGTPILVMICAGDGIEEMEASVALTPDGEFSIVHDEIGTFNGGTAFQYQNAQPGYWRARARKGSTWSDYSTPIQVQAPVLPLYFTMMNTNSAIQLSWNAVTGLVYQVQYKTNLFQTNWINLGAAITVTNTITTTIPDVIGADPQRFYRVLWVTPD